MAHWYWKEQLEMELVSGFVLNTWLLCHNEVEKKNRTPENQLKKLP